MTTWGDALAEMKRESGLRPGDLVGCWECQTPLVMPDEERWAFIEWSDDWEPILTCQYCLAEAEDWDEP